MSQPLRIFFFNWQCVVESFEQDEEQRKKKERERDNGIYEMKSTFQEWQEAAKKDMEEDRNKSKKII